MRTFAHLNLRLSEQKQIFMPKKQILDIPKLWELSDIWGALTPEEKDLVEQNTQYYSYKKNEIICREGDEPSNMMMLVSGKVRIYKEGVSNRNQIIRMLKPCDFFGYRSIIAGECHNTSASTVEPSVVYFIKKDAFLQVLNSNHRFCYLILVEMSRDLGKSDTRTVSLTQKHIRGRLAESLLALKDQYGLDEDEATISMYLSREDLASLSSMTTSNAIRTLSDFQQEGMISLDGRKIKILEMDQLVRTSRLG